MATRVPGLKFIAERTGEALVTVENCSRVMTAAQVPAPYNTSIGRGNRHAHLSAEWLCSTFLALVLADPKNAPVRVPAIGNLPMRQTLAVNRRRDSTHNRLSPGSPNLETIFTVGTVSPKKWLGETVFDLLVKLTTTLAIDWNGPTHLDLRKKFNLTIGIERFLSAEMELWDRDDEDGSEWWIRSSYHHPLGIAAYATVDTVPIARQAVIEVRHIEMLATMYHDTLKNEATVQASSVPTLTPDVAARTDAGPTNENGAPGRAPPTRNQDQNSIPEAHTPEPRRESENPQAQSSSDPGPPQHVMRTSPDEHADSHLPFTLVA